VAVIVNRAHRFIFIKTKKTGSSSTERWLNHYSTAEGTLQSTHGAS
jgi:hypothetical protein